MYTVYVVSILAVTWAGLKNNTLQIKSPKRLNYNALVNLIEIKCPISGLLFRAGH